MSEFFEHVVTEGLRLDHLAHRYYGDAMRMEDILKTNPALVGFEALSAAPGAALPSLRVAEFLPSGVAIKVPAPDLTALSDISPQVLPPWKR